VRGAEERTDTGARVVTIIGGLGYAVLVAAEGIDLLGAPLPHDDAASVVA
jgi:hypothetical protein